jgi:hypothetical protein
MRLADASPDSLPGSTTSDALRFDSIVILLPAGTKVPDLDGLRVALGGAVQPMLVIRPDDAQTGTLRVDDGGRFTELFVSPGTDAATLHRTLLFFGAFRPVLVVGTLALVDFVSRFSALAILLASETLLEEARAAPGLDEVLATVDVALWETTAAGDWLSSTGFERPTMALAAARLGPAAPGTGRLNVLFLYDEPSTPINCIRDDLDAARRHLAHDVWFAPATAFAGPLECPTPLDAFDAIVIHYAVRLSLPAYLSPDFAEAIRDFGGYKVLFVQDDYETTECTRRWIESLGIHHVFTAVPSHSTHLVYPPERFPHVEVEHRLTGFVPDNLERRPRVPLAGRPLVIGYRGRQLGWWYGDLPREKFFIGERMRELCEARGVAVDIRCDEASRFYGEAWIRFVESSRAVLGTESGSNVFDDFGELKRQIVEARSAEPDLTYGQVFERFLAPHEGRVRMNQISPRVFEAIALGTALVLFEGDYSGVIRPHEHYIPLAKDFSNIDEVLARLDDLPALEQMTERAWREVVGSGKYTYRTFYARLSQVLTERVRRGNGRRIVEGLLGVQMADGSALQAGPRGVPTRDIYHCQWPSLALSAGHPRSPRMRSAGPMDAFHLLHPLPSGPRPAAEFRERIAARCDSVIIVSRWTRADFWDALIRLFCQHVDVYVLVLGEASGPAFESRRLQVVRGEETLATLNERMCEGGAIRPLVITDDPRGGALLARRYAVFRVLLESAEAALEYGGFEALADLRARLGASTEPWVGVDRWDLDAFGRLLAERLEGSRPLPPRRRLNLLALYDDGATRINCVRDDIESVLRLSEHDVFAAVATGDAVAEDLSAFDAVLFTYSVRLAKTWHLSPSFALAIRRFGGFKAAIITDEYDTTDTARGWIESLGIHAVFTAVPVDWVPIVYPPARHPRVEFIHKLTGFVPPELERLAEHAPPIRARSTGLGYRGRSLPYWYGDLGQEKGWIGERMKRVCEEREVDCDIAWDENSRLYGQDWLAFHMRCKAVLGTESGTRIFDEYGDVRKRIETLLEARPDLPYEEVRSWLQAHERVPMNQISPRIFEAIACRTALVLYEGTYSGVVEPHEHFIPLAKDLGNVDEVLALLRDDDYLEAMVERAWRHVIGSRRFTYLRFAEEFDEWLGQRAGGLAPAIATVSAAGSWDRFGKAIRVADIHPRGHAMRELVDWFRDIYPGSRQWQAEWLARADREQRAFQLYQEMFMAAEEAIAQTAVMPREVVRWKEHGVVRWVDACVFKPFNHVWEYNRRMLSGENGPSSEKVPGLRWIKQCVFHPFNQVWEYNRLLLVGRRGPPSQDT